MTKANAKSTYAVQVLGFNAALKEEQKSPVQAIKVILYSEEYRNNKELQKAFSPFFGSGKEKEKVNTALKALNEIAPKNENGQFVRTHKGQKIAKTTFSAFWVLQMAYKYLNK